MRPCLERSVLLLTNSLVGPGRSFRLLRPPVVLAGMCPLEGLLNPLKVVNLELLKSRAVCLYETLWGKQI